MKKVFGIIGKIIATGFASWLLIALVGAIIGGVVGAVDGFIGLNLLPGVLAAMCSLPGQMVLSVLRMVLWFGMFIMWISKKKKVGEAA